jgi:hypothetical protein
MRIRISGRVLRRIGWTAAIVAVLAGLYFLGDYLTPRGADGRPLILSPSVRKAEAYRRAVLGWVDEMREMEEGLEELLAQGEVVDSAQLYDLSRDAQELVEQAAAVVGDAAFTSPPPALVGLMEKAQTAAGAYFDAAQAAALWVGSPEPESLQAAMESLQYARERREELEASRWLVEEGDDERP